MNRRFIFGYLIIVLPSLVLFQIGCSSTKESSVAMADGEYEMKFDDRYSSTYEGFKLKIDKDAYEKKFKSGVIVKGTLQRFSSNMYIFIDNTSGVAHKDTTELEKQLRGLGNQIVELKDLANDTMMFRTTFQANLNVIINEGIIVKNDE